MEPNNHEPQSWDPVPPGTLSGIARRRQEQLRPWVPNLYLGASAGGYGGGPNGHFADFEGRFDLDALAVWEFENLGLGNQARVREAASRQRQNSLEFQRVRDLVATQVVQAYHRARIADERIEVAREQVEAAARAVPLNFRGIRGGQLRPIEALQAIVQLATARETYLTAVIDHNRQQLHLLHAIGNPVRSQESTALTDGFPDESPAEVKNDTPDD